MSVAGKGRRVIFIGASMAGKTTLTQAMMREELRYRKTQTLDIVGGFIIDTPGESFFPPAFASMFGKPVAGVVTKADIASPEEIEEAKRRLARAGVKRVFVTSAYTGEGIQEFIDFIDSLD